MGVLDHHQQLREQACVLALSMHTCLDAGEDECVHAHGAREPKVTELDDTALANEDVLRLHVAMHDPVLQELSRNAP